MSKRIREDDENEHINEVPLPVTSSLRCDIPPCHLRLVFFEDYLSYEAHVSNQHSFLCESCAPRKVFPSEKFLNIHIDEHHNPFLRIARDKGEKVYRCFDCDKICSTKHKRRLHMIDKHGYAKDFDFGIVNHGLGNRRSSKRNDCKS